MTEKHKQKGKKIAPNNAVKSIDNQKVSWVGDITYPIRDLLIKSMERGQLLLCGVLVVIMIFLFRLPENDLSAFTTNLLNRVQSNDIWGFILFFTVCLVWFFHNRYIRKIHRKEITRITNEKDEIQKKLFNLITK